MSKILLRYSFRFYPCLALCAILGGGLILERFLALVKSRRIWELSLGAALLAVLAYHLAMCQGSFYTYGFLPFPPLPPAFEAVFHPYAERDYFGAKNSRRIASWTQQRSPAPDHYLALPLNLPHYYQVPSIFGYDPVVEGQPLMRYVLYRMDTEPVAACKAYGVGLHMLSYSAAPVLSGYPRVESMERTFRFEPAYRGLEKAHVLKRVAQVEGTTMLELPGVDPLAFATARPDTPLPMRLHCRGADIDVAGLAEGTPVTVNFLRYPQIALYLDGQPLAVGGDDWERITTTLPHAGEMLSLRFEPPWRTSCLVGVLLCLAALLLAWLLVERR
jgi:hypothetical protein